MKTKFTFLALALALAGCAGSAPHYYSLQGGDPAPAASTAVRAAYAISVQPVVIPQQVARPQIVVRMTPGSEVVPLNTALWAGPLEAQIRSAVADELTRRLNVLDVAAARVGEGLPVWRIYVDMQRFDSLYGQHVQQEAVWRLVPQGMRQPVAERVCTAQATVQVGAGMAALVEGHRQALAGIAQAIGAAVSAGSGANASGTAVQLPEGIVFRGCVG